MRSFAFNFRHLRALAATRRTGSISAAAERVNLSQPAVTQAVAKSEALAGAPLFERRPNGMAATEAGLLFAARAEAAAGALAQGFAAIRRQGSGGFGGADQLVTMTQARAMLALADAGSYAAAARATGLSQPSLHRAIRDVERLCGVVLVERRGRGVGLTAAGFRLVRAFRLAVNELEAGLEELAALAGRDSGVVRVGAMPLSRARLLPLATARFHARHPTARVEIAEGSHVELIERLRDGALDFLVGALRVPDPGPDVAQEILLEDRLMVVAGSRHPLRATAEPSLAMLAAYPWAMAREGTPLRQQWRAMFAQGGIAPPAAPVTCGSVMVIRTLLIESDFLTLLSPEQVRLELASGVLVGIGRPLEATRRAIGLTTRVDWRPTPAQAAYLDALREQVAAARLPESQ